MPANNFLIFHINFPQFFSPPNQSSQLGIQNSLKQKMKMSEFLARLAVFFFWLSSGVELVIVSPDGCHDKVFITFYSMQKRCQIFSNPVPGIFPISTHGPFWKTLLFWLPISRELKM